MPSYLSYSQLALYLECPLKYKLRYLAEGGYGDEQVPAALAFGSAIHQALTHFYRQAMDGEPFTLVTFLETFTAAWQAETEKQEILFGKEENFASLLALGQEMLRVFARLAHPMKVIASTRDDTTVHESHATESFMYEIYVSGIFHLYYKL